MAARSSVQRKNHDFEVLYRQQKRLQQISDYKNVNIVKAKRRLEDKFYSNSSLFCLYSTNPIRKFLIKLVLTKYFDYFILIVILANCVIITIPEIIHISWQDSADLVFLWIYTIESILKIVCMGFFMGKYSYLRDPWNILDFIVMLTGWIGILFKSASISIVRTIRILRPLRTFNSVPEMKTLIVSIFRAFPLLLDIFLLFLFTLFVFALIGVQIYAGQLNHRCISSEGVMTEKLCYIPRGCQEFDVNCVGTGCGEDEYCWITDQNPNQNCTSFDNIFVSMLTVFIAVTLEGWSDVMRFGRKVLNQKFFNDIYFIALIIVVSFFLVKLTVAAIYVKFIQTREEEEKVKAEPVFWDSCPDEPFVGQNSWEYKWYLIRTAAYKVIKSEWFDWFFFIMITINTCIMASEYYGMSDFHMSIISYFNSCLTVCFSIELILKVTGLGARNYLNSIGNIFDGLLVIIGFIEIATLLQHEALSKQNMLRMVRVLRVFKLAKKWQGLRVILQKLINSTRSICYLGLITFITIFVYTLLGKRLFEGRLDDGYGDVPRANFNNFWWAFVTVFTLVTGENWNSIFYNTIEPNGWVYSIYFLSLIVIGGYILLNLFIAILLEQFDDDHSQETKEPNNVDIENTILYRYQQVARLENKKKDLKRRAKIKMKFTDVNVICQDLRLEGNSYCIFSPTNKIRLFFKAVMIHPYFDNLIYCLIVMSCASLVVDEPNQPEFTSRFLSLYNRVTLSLFILEFIIKSIVLGFVGGKNSYLKSVWNVIDLIIIVFSLLDEVLSVSVKSFNFVRAFRALRGLRPLRMVSHNENMRKVISSIFAAIPAVLNVMLVTFLFYIVFGIIGVIFFKGIMYRCTDPQIDLIEDCKGSFVDRFGNEQERSWEGSPYNFNNLVNGILTLFSISTLEAWPTYMYAAVDGVGPGKSQKRDANQSAALFYITFIFITNFFIMNLYLGAVIKKFNEIQEEIDGSFFLSNTQKEWVRTQKLMINCSPKIRYLQPDNKFRKFFFRMVLDYKFEYVIQSVIFLNIIIMSLYTYPTDNDLNDFQNVSNIIFICIFSFEFIAKVLGVGVRFYFASKSNRFDCFILVLSVISASNYLNFSNALVLRVLRISRLFRIMKIFKNFRSLIKTLIVSLPSLLNVGAILCLLWFIYGISGGYLFSEIDYTNATILSDDINFKTFYNSVMVLFQSITGENWNLIMIDCMGYNCSAGPDKCGSPISATMFWISYTILGQYFFFSLFIAVILENFASCEQDISVTGLHHNDLKKFQQVWSIYAPYGESYIDTKFIPSFLQYLDPPLGFKGQNLSRAKMLHIVLALGISDVKGKVHFAEFLWKLAHAVSGTDMSTAAPCEALRNIQKILPRKLPYSSSYEPSASLAAKTLAAYLIIDNWRIYKKSKTIELTSNTRLKRKKNKKNTNS